MHQCRLRTSRLRRGARALASALVLAATSLDGVATLAALPDAGEWPSPYRVAVDQILVRHAGARAASGEGRSERTRDEARAIAADALAALRAGRLPFDVATARYSDDTLTRGRGGYWGTFARGEFTEEFAPIEKAIFSLRVGEVSDVVETPLGLQIFRRVELREWAGAHILVQFAGAEHAPAGLERSEDEARALARSLLAEARAPGADFATLARRHSGAPDAGSGGALGVFGPYEILPPLEKEIARLALDEVGGPVRSRLGFHIVQRQRPQQARVAQILVRFAGVDFDETVTRTREEALARAREVLRRYREGEPFRALAKEYSEDGSGARGGDLGLFRAGEMDPAFEKASFALEVSEVSAPVETRYGLHIILRLPEE